MPARGFVFSTDPPPEALAYFRNKGLRPSFNWQDVWAQEHAFAFTVAKATQLEVLLSIRKAVDDALAKGLTFDDFAKQLAPRLQKFGWWGRQFVVDPLTDEEIIAQLGSPQRLRLIYDANLRSAHAAGQWDRAQRTKAVLPFFLYVETISREPRDEHLAQVGTIAEIDDSYWDIWFPPNGYGCKCSARQITRAEAQKRGWKPGSKPPAWETRPFLNKRTGVVEDIPVGIDPGWHFNPAKARFSMLDQLLSGKLDDIAPELRAVAMKDMTSNWLFKRFAAGDFYDIKVPMKTPDIAVPAAHLDKELRKITGRQSGIVWLTPEKPFVFEKPSLATWAKLPKVIDEGAVVKDRADPSYLIFYRRVAGKTYKAEVAVRDATPQGTRIKGGRFELQHYHEIEANIAKYELDLAEAEKRLVRREVSKAGPADPPAIIPFQQLPELGPPAFPPGQRQTFILDDGQRVEGRHIKRRGNSKNRRIELRVGNTAIGELNYQIVSEFGTKGRLAISYVEIAPQYRRKGLATQLYDRLQAWADEEGLILGPSADLMDDGFAFWKTRQPDHPRVVSDARNYMAELVEYGQKRHGAKVQIDVELDGRSVNFNIGGRTVENASYDALAEAGVIPQIPPFKWDGGSAP